MIEIPTGLIFALIAIGITFGGGIVVGEIHGYRNGYQDATKEIQT